MRTALRRFRADVGGDPLSVLVLLACLALGAFAFYKASFGPLPVRMLIWFIAAIIGHDLVLYPLYALADRSWAVFSRQSRRRVRTRERSVPVVNYLRVPALLSGLYLLVFWGLISGEGNRFFVPRADHAYAGYLTRWLITVGVLFGISAILYAVRLARTARGSGDPAGSPRPSPVARSTDGTA